MSEQRQAPSTGRRSATFFGGFLLVAVVLAGLDSYLASPNPDGLDKVSQQGCQVTEVNGAEQLEGQCIARNATEDPFAEGPFAGYTVGGNDKLTGIAGVVGVLATLAVAGGLFWVLRRRSSGNAPTAPPGA